MKKPKVRNKIQKHPVKSLKSEVPLVKPLWYVYAIECDNASVYIGQTRDLIQRWEQHLKGQGAQWTRKYEPLQLFYAEQCKSHLAARRREQELKKTKGRKFLKDVLKKSDPQVNKSIQNFYKGGNHMSAAASALLTAGNIAKVLSVSDAKVKKVIQELGIKPVAKKGVCNYYSKDTVSKVKGALK